MTNGFVFYRFDAYDVDLEMNIDCYVQLQFSPSSRSSSSAMRTTIILGEFNANDVSQQAYDWFKGQYNVEIDHTSLLDFLTTIQKYVRTRFVAVVFDIQKSDYNDVKPS